MEFGSVSFCYIKTMQTIFEKVHARVTVVDERNGRTMGSTKTAFYYPW